MKSATTNTIRPAGSGRPFTINKSAATPVALKMLENLEECCNRSDDYFHGTVSTAPAHTSPTDRLAHKCVSLQFLVEFYEQIVKPYKPDMTVSQVQEQIIIPATNDLKCSFIDKLWPTMYVTPHAFISHAFGNKIIIMVESLKSYFKDAVFAEIYIWIDIFVINQHKNNAVADLLGGLTLKATIEASGSVVVCLDKKAVPLSRLWCLYEIGSTPIEKLVMLTYGFDASELGQAYAKIDATTADCFLPTDKDMIRKDIRTTMIQRNFVGSAATEEDALKAFTRVLKLLLILKPTSYSADMAALLARAADYQRYPLPVTVGQGCTGGKLICIVGGSGEGKSTLAAALVKEISIDAYHFCKQSDVRRQDRGLVIRSLSYQLATRHQAFAQTILDLTPSQVESISDDATAWKLLIEDPLRAAGGHQFTIMVDALDEGGLNGQMVSFLVELDNVVRGTINIIVTTRSEPQVIVSALRSHWKGDCYKEFTPSELRGEVQTGGGVVVSPLLRTLGDIVRRKTPTSTIAVPGSINTAYDMIFPRSAMEQHRAVLEVVLASYEPQSLSDLKAMGLLEMARRLPGYGELFLERENKLHLLHRSIAEWLKELAHGTVDVKRGHMRLAAHIWEMMLRPWLLPTTTSSTPSTISWEPSPGSYSLKYALDHLREAGRLIDIQAVLFRLPLLQAMLREKGVSALIKDILTLTSHPTLEDVTKKLVAVLRLSRSALVGSDAWKYLPAQLFGRLRETEDDRLLLSLREESNSLTTDKWLKPLKSSLLKPWNLEMTLQHEGNVSSLVMLSNERIVSCSDDKTLRIWNVMSGKCETVLSGHEGPVKSVIILSDGRIVSCSNDKTIRIWNATTGDCEKVLSGHEGPVHSAIALPLDRLVSCSLRSSDNTIRVWNATTGNCEKVYGHTESIDSFNALPDGRIVFSSGTMIHIWNPTTGDCAIDFFKERSFNQGHDGLINFILPLPNDRIVSCSDDGTLCVWNVITGDFEKMFVGHYARVRSAISLPGDRIVSCSYGKKSLYVWDIKTEKANGLGLYEYDSRAVNEVIALPDGRIVSCYDDKMLRIWHKYTGTQYLSGHEGAVRSVIALPDGRLVSCSNDKTVRVGILHGFLFYFTKSIQGIEVVSAGIWCFPMAALSPVLAISCSCGIPRLATARISNCVVEKVLITCHGQIAGCYRTAQKLTGSIFVFILGKYPWSPRH